MIVEDRKYVEDYIPDMAALGRFDRFAVPSRMTATCALASCTRRLRTAEPPSCRLARVRGFDCQNCQN
jgi:hypothetical protein